MTAAAVYPMEVDDCRGSGALVFFRIVVERIVVSTSSFRTISSRTSLSSSFERFVLLKLLQTTLDNVVVLDCFGSVDGVGSILLLILLLLLSIVTEEWW